MTTALILAAQRGGIVDPLAAAFGVSHKCVVPIAGRPLIAHVIDALAGSAHIGEIRISIDDPTALEGIPAATRLLREGRLHIVPARDNLADSVVAAAKGVRFPLLVTTADNVLLDPQAVDAIERGAADAGADVAVAFATRAAVLTAHPDGQRRFYRFSCDAYSNCNAYWIGNAKALKLTETFRGGGQFAKHPRRIVEAFGLANLIRFRFGIGTLAAAFARFSRRFGVRIRPIILADGAIAIDVDNARTHAIAQDLLNARAPALLAAAE